MSPADIETVNKLLTRENDEVVRFISRLSTARDGIRAAALTLIGSLAGLAVANESLAIAIVGIPIILALGLEDSHLRALNDQAIGRLLALEATQQLYLDYLVEGGVLFKTELATRFVVEAKALPIGFNRRLKARSTRTLLSGLFRRPWPFLLGIAMLCVVAGWIGFLMDKDDLPSPAVCVVVAVNGTEQPGVRNECVPLT